MQRKRIVTAVAVTAIAGLALAGCSSGGSGGKSGSSATISYMTWESNPTNAALDKTMKKFSKSSGITVERNPAPNADYAQKLASLIMSKKAPDFFWCSTAQEQNLASEGLLYDWTDKLKSGDGLKTKNFSPGSLDMWRNASGKVFGIPTLANTYGFFYNKATFEAAGLTVPKIGWTYDDMFADIAKLKQTDPSTTPLVTQWPLLDSPQGVSAYSVANGGKALLDKNIGATSITTDATFKKGAQRFADAVSAGEMTNLDYDATNAIAAFSNGGIPLMFGGQWLQTQIEPNKPKFDWGYAPWPVGTKQSVQPIETNGVCSPATLKDPDATWKTISYMESTGFNDAMKAEPVAPIAYEPGSKGYYAALDDGDAASKSIAATARYELGTKKKFVTGFLDVWATKAGDIVTTSWNPALNGKKDLNAGISATVTGIKKLMSK